jgi:pimeloyl-ACP methyl ester carboxylesterase
LNVQKPPFTSSVWPVSVRSGLFVWASQRRTTVLAASDIDGPFIFIGHSYGPWILSLYASAHPDDVAGMICVSHADAIERLEDQRHAVRGN